MLEIRNVYKDYPAGDAVVHALRNVNIAFRDCELVTLLGPSNCGKSALLSLIAARGDCTRGDILLDGVSSKRLSEAERDAWRSRIVGFVSEACPLLADRNLLENVELAMTLTGTAGSARRRRAADALRLVGLGSQMRALPGQLSAGQRLCAELARALVNSPDVLLVDDPAGALEGESAGRVPDILREAARKRLVIVAAREGADEGGAARVVRLLEGRVVADSAPFAPEAAVRRDRPARKPALRLGSAFSLAFRALSGRRARSAFLTLAVAAAVMGGGLAVSLLRGAQSYDAAAQLRTLAACPLAITRDTSDTAAFLAYLRGDGSAAASCLREIHCRYDVTPRVYASAAADGVKELNGPDAPADGVWTELLDDEELRNALYSVAAGRWPSRYDETALVVDGNGAVGAETLRALGLAAETEDGQTAAEWHFEDILGTTYKLLLPSDYYRQGADGLWAGIAGDADLMRDAVAGGLTLHVVGILRAAGDSVASGKMGYTSDLTAYILGHTDSSAAVTAQRADETTDIFTGLPFLPAGSLSLGAPEKAAAFLGWADGMAEPQQTELYIRLSGASASAAASLSAGGTLAAALRSVLSAQSESALAALYDEYAAVLYAPTTLEENLASLGVAEDGSPASLELYAVTYADRAAAAELIAGYNESVTAAGEGEKAVSCTDGASALLASGAETQRVHEGTLRAFLVLTLAVSAILTAVLAGLFSRQYAPEIGILRALGASRSDISGVVTAGALTVGAAASLAGLGAAALLCPAAGTAVAGLTGLASLPWRWAAALALGCLLLTLLSALLPARRAARRESAENLPGA